MSAPTEHELSENNNISSELFFEFPFLSEENQKFSKKLKSI